MIRSTAPPVVIRLPRTRAILLAIVAVELGLYAIGFLLILVKVL